MQIDKMRTGLTARVCEFMQPFHETFDELALRLLQATRATLEHESTGPARVLPCTDVIDDSKAAFCLKVIRIVFDVEYNELGA